MLKIRIGKKGIFFTFAAIVLSVVIILSFNVYNDYRLRDEMEVVEIRINTMTDFVKNLKNDLDNAIFIVGYRSLLSLEDYMMDHDKFFNVDETPTLEAAFDEVFRLGTIDYEGSSEKMSMMDDNTFFNWTERMKVAANKTDIEVDFTINSVTITQTEPWMVDVAVNLNINIQDKKNTASWAIDKVEGYTRKINITGFVDPLYLVNTDGVANNTIKENTETFPGGNLATHLNGHYYMEHNGANTPSYLDRFENTVSGSNGIESLVTDKLKDEGITVDTSKSAVDYIYFSSTVTLECNVHEISDADFYLDCDPDPNHVDFYDAKCQGSCG